MPSSNTSGQGRNYRLSQRDWSTIIMLLIAAFTVILNETIMNVALPTLMVELDVEPNTVQWLSTAFLLTMAVVIPMTGFILQRFTTRVVFIAAMSLFSLGTLLAGIAPGFLPLLVGRVVQASGTAIMIPLLMTTILGLVPANIRGGVLGTVSIVISVAPALGPTVSGLILNALPWRFMFLLVLPIALVVLVIGATRLVNVGEVRRSSIDVVSVVLSAFGFGGFVYGVSRAGEGPGAWSDPQVVAAMVVGALSLVIFFARQRALQRSGDPLLDLRAFRYPMFTLSVAIFMIVMMGLFGSMILLPIYLQNVRGFGSLETGLLLLPGGALMGLAAPIVGRLYDRYGPQVLTTPGAALLTLILWRFSTITADTPVAVLLSLHLVLSLGMAMIFTPLMTTGLNPLPARLHSHGSAIMSTLQQVAGAVGTALLITIMTNRAIVLGRTVSTDLAQAAGLRSAFGVASAIALVALVLTFFLRRSLPEEVEEEEHAQIVPTSEAAAL
ncbi:MAG TPA: DHA2 family efflux MFS transporter permease subunit [Trueperaceae bacterium]